MHHYHCVFDCWQFVFPVTMMFIVFSLFTRQMWRTVCSSVCVSKMTPLPVGEDDDEVGTSLEWVHMWLCCSWRPFGTVLPWLRSQGCPWDKMSRHGRVNGSILQSNICSSSLQCRCVVCVSHFYCRVVKGHKCLKNHMLTITYSLMIFIVIYEIHKRWGVLNLNKINDTLWKNCDAKDCTINFCNSQLLN